MGLTSFYISLFAIGLQLIVILNYNTVGGQRQNEFFHVSTIIMIFYFNLSLVAVNGMLMASQSDKELDFSSFGVNRGRFYEEKKMYVGAVEKVFSTIYVVALSFDTHHESI